MSFTKATVLEGYRVEGSGIVCRIAEFRQFVLDERLIPDDVKRLRKPGTFVVTVEFVPDEVST